MSRNSKIEHLKENISSLETKMKKLELQKQVYQMQLDILEQQPEEPEVTNQSPPSKERDKK